MHLFRYHGMEQLYDGCTSDVYTKKGRIVCKYKLVFFLSLAYLSVAGNINFTIAGEQSATALPNPILFVTQVPIPLDTSTITGVFANHLATTKSCGRGGDLY